MDLIEDMGAEERGGLLVTRGTQTDWTGESNGKQTGTVGSQTDEVGGRMIVTKHTETKHRIFTFAEQLLPGLPDEITLDHICTKLPWTAFDILMRVSRLWKQAIRSRKVYDARVRANSTETFVVLQHRVSHSYGIALYSMKNNLCYRVPGISQFKTGFPKKFKCVAVDGKIYVLGGDFGRCYSEVYKLDLAGQKEEWEPCEGMDTPRQNLELEVMDGKIYVCGGEYDNFDPYSGCKMYDPREDVWSSISSMIFSRSDHHITALGGELFAYGGCFYDSCEDSDAPGSHVHDALFLEVYNPGQNKWRVVDPFGRQDLQRLFVARGNVYLMTPSGVYALDDGNVEKNAWTELHSFSLPHVTVTQFDLCPTLAVDDELLTMCACEVNAGGGPLNAEKICLLRTKGLGGKTKELVWEEANCPLSFGSTSSMCLIQL